MKETVNVAFLYEGTVVEIKTFVGSDIEAMNRKAEEYFIKLIKEELGYTLTSFEAFKKSTATIKKELNELNDEEFVNSLLEDGVWSGYDKNISIHHGTLREV